MRKQHGSSEISILLIVVWLLQCSLSGVVLAVKTALVMSVDSDVHQLKLGKHLKLSTWNCGGLTFTQRQLCQELGYNMLALTETHEDL